MPADRSNKRSSFSGRTSPYGEPPREQINPETNEECMQRGKSRSASARSNPMNPGARGVTTSSARDTKQSNRKDTTSSGTLGRGTEKSFNGCWKAKHTESELASLPELPSHSASFSTRDIDTAPGMSPPRKCAEADCFFTRPAGQFTNNNIQMSVPSNFNSQWNSSSKFYLTPRKIHVCTLSDDIHLIPPSHPLWTEGSASSNGFYNAARQFPDNTQMSETLPSDLSFQLNSGNPLRPQGSASRNDFLNVPAHGGFPFVSTNFQGSGYQNTIYSPMEGFSAAAPPVPYAPQMIGISPLCYEFSKSSRLPTVPPKETKEKKDH
ncbi:uncharacterized protein MELLADRAFT_69396 [Melampsora larici-populina 98AG31]|uniref:Uncharacterized protein n=1 Tax=Melampsora larici-populina (strain 98AG31 / pathotype 3-4-7) TaxID=747676 RepID=F4SAJ9_MELLP|nr:uncharacterized protein MELLADRAFT_69396 [Melampsora larici-populina 98AG31]EGF98338.1 hypothetical protein MELLADRAFT_69396 [Melampsora larici-populina 98AG31]